MIGAEHRIQLVRLRVPLQRRHRRVKQPMHHRVIADEIRLLDAEAAAAAAAPAAVERAAATARCVYGRVAADLARLREGAVGKVQVLDGAGHVDVAREMRRAQPAPSLGIGRIEAH